MKILNFLRKSFIKKSRKIFKFLLFFVFITSCEKDLSKFGQVNFHGSNSKNFTFFVSEEYIRATQDSKPDQSNPKISEAEAKLLTNLLQKRNYCLNDQGKIFYRITSRQEKIYDMTFAHLIEQNYNARPVTPLMYYGECLSRPITKKDALDQIVKETEAAIK